MVLEDPLRYACCAESILHSRQGVGGSGSPMSLVKLLQVAVICRPVRPVIEGPGNRQLKAELQAMISSMGT